MFLSDDAWAPSDPLLGQALPTLPVVQYLWGRHCLHRQAWPESHGLQEALRCTCPAPPVPQGSGADRCRWGSPSLDRVSCHLLLALPWAKAGVSTRAQPGFGLPLGVSTARAVSSATFLATKSVHARVTSQQKESHSSSQGHFTHSGFVACGTVVSGYPSVRQECRREG